MKFSLQRQSFPVELEGPNGQTLKLEMREMTAAQRDKYLDGLGERLRFDANGMPVGMKKFTGMQASLLSLCLYNGEALVKAEEIQGWPAGVATQLFEEAQRLNHLEKETTADEPKND